LGWLVVAAGLGLATEAFTVRFGASGGLDMPLDGAAGAVVQLGQRAEALAGDDPADVPAPPSPPGGGVPLLYLAAPDAQLGQYLHDFRPQAASQTWELDLVGMTTGAAVTLRWRVEDGRLGGLPLRLLDRQTRAVLVADMAATTEFTCQDADRALLVVYGDANRPPLARGDQVTMLASAGSIGASCDAVLANDYDPDGDAIAVVRVGSPHLPGGSSDPGSTDYGTAAFDPLARHITYTLPATLPPDWTGTVALDYTVRDNALPSPAESTAVLLVAVASHLVMEPERPRFAAPAGTAIELAYTLRHTGALQSLSLEFALPMVGHDATLGFWQFAGGYSDDDADSTPAIDSGYGPDGIAGTDDDTGLVRIDFGTTVPHHGTRLTFRLQCPVAAAPEAVVQALARYRFGSGRGTAASQALDSVTILVTPYVPQFVAGPGGAVTVEQDGSAITATARPASGYRFVQWTRAGVPYSSANPLTLTGVTEVLTLTASFDVSEPVPPSGDFLAAIDTAAVANGRGFWNLTGTYSTTAHGSPLTLLMEHDVRGRLTGTAAYQVAAAGNPPLRMSIRGSARGANGSVVLRFVSRGSDAVSGVGAALGFVLMVDPANRRLTGPMTGAVTIGGVEHPIPVAESPQAWSIAAPMDGSWTLRFTDLSLGPASAVSGGAVLTLSSGDALRFLANGRLGADGLTTLALSGAPGELEARALAFSAEIQTSTGTPECGLAALRRCSGRGYGQTLGW
jgi:hypothetical protein